MDYFEKKQAAAVLKHGILRRYLHVFVSKTGSPAGEVVYVDGYAGPGLTGREVYTAHAAARRTPNQYEAWLAPVLRSALLTGGEFASP